MKKKWCVEWKAKRGSSRLKSTHLSVEAVARKKFDTLKLQGYRVRLVRFKHLCGLPVNEIIEDWGYSPTADEIKEAQDRQKKKYQHSRAKNRTILMRKEGVPLEKIIDRLTYWYDMVSKKDILNWI